ncbi:MAG: type III secretion system chaperone [Methylocystis sp.]|uniref:type III secretion system chaperone n=1 Tax=Methylocystis sp. TaxID=1911079 RepID=UPI003DA353F5
MQNVDEAVDALARKSNLPTLKLNDAGVAEVVVGENLSVLLIKRGQTELEFATYLEARQDRNESVLARLLQANHLGDAVGAGRIALDPDTDRLLLCERVDAAMVDEHSLERRLLEFIKYAAFWQSEEAQALLGDETSVSPGLSEGMFRI